MTASKEDVPRTCRYERKFFISDLSYAEVELIIRLNPRLFTEIFHPRWVNNIYLDSPELDSYYDNIDGALFRTKIRVRWYGDLMGVIEKPKLEFKFKRGLLGSKDSYVLTPFTLDEKFSRNTVLELARASSLPELVRHKMRSSVPSLVNYYRRKYFGSADGRFRITLDDRQRFHFVGAHNNHFLHSVSNDHDVVLELKYDQQHDDLAATITNHFPFRLTKSSKYVMGIKVTHF
jgi:hypothetical protein